LADRYPPGPVVNTRRGEAVTHLLVRAGPGDPVPPGWTAHSVGMEELALAYLREPTAAALPGPGRTVREAEVARRPHRQCPSGRRGARACLRCRGGRSPGSPGASTGSRWPA